MWVFYPSLKAYPKVVQPAVVVPASWAFSLFYFVNGIPIVGVRAGYPHLLIYPAVFTVLLLAASRWFRYGFADSFVLSLLGVVSISSLWELPFILSKMLTPLGFGAVAGTTGWQLMAIPLFFYFLIRINGREAYSRPAIFFGAACMVATMFFWVYVRPTTFVYVGGDALLLVWGAFMLAAMASKNRGRAPNRPGLSAYDAIAEKANGEPLATVSEPETAAPATIPFGLP